MTPRAQGKAKARGGLGVIPALMLVLGGIGLLSCPNPIDEALLTIVEDEIDPVITITQPAANSFYKTRITVVGALEDSAKEEADHLGSPGTLEVRIPNASSLNRLVTSQADGSYSVSPADSTFTYDPASGSFGLEISAVALSGTLTVTILAEDSAARDSQTSFTIIDDPIRSSIFRGELGADNSYLEVTFGEAVYSTSAGSGALAGGEQIIRVNLSYSATPIGAEKIEVRPASDSVYAAVGNEAPTSTSPGIKALNDQLVPEVQYVSSVTPDGTYGTGETIDLTVRFSEAVYVTGSPTLLLETGARWRTAGRVFVSRTDCRAPGPGIDAPASAFSRSAAGAGCG